MSINILNDDLISQIKDVFNTQMASPVELIYFYNNDTCDTCDETKQLLEEITALSDQLHINIYDIAENLPDAQKFNIQLTPGLVVAGRDGDDFIDYGIRFFGIPSGYEFGSLIQAIILVSKRDSGLKPDIRDQLKELKKPVNLQVFVTPT